MNARTTETSDSCSAVPRTKSNISSFGTSFGVIVDPRLYTRCHVLFWVPYGVAYRYAPKQDQVSSRMEVIGRVRFPPTPGTHHQSMNLSKV